MEKKSYLWFERRRRSRALDLAQEQIIKALDTVSFLNQAMQMLAKGNKKEAIHSIDNIFKVEREVDRLRTEVFKELSKGVALVADYREDIMHLVKRLDTLADHVKDVARCVLMLEDAEIPKELWEKAAYMTSVLFDCARALRLSIENIGENPAEAMNGAKKVEEIERKIDDEYLSTKKLFIKYADRVNSGSMVIFNNLVEFIEHAADMCADTADYIVILASRE